MAATEEQFALVERPADGIALLRISRPERLNALGVAVTNEVIDALTTVEDDPSVRALVLTGAGRAFSAGGDIREVAERVAGGGVWERLSLLRDVQHLVVRLRDSRLPVVCAVSGPAFGAGWSVVLATDFVVVAQDARFQQAFVHRNLVPDLGSAWLLPRTVGMLRAKELMLLGEELSAQDAVQLGLANRLVTDRAAAEKEACAVAMRLAAAAPATVAMAKRLINTSDGTTFQDSLRLEEHAQALALGAPDTVAAIEAFRRRRAV